MSQCVLHPHALSVRSSLKSHQDLRSFSPHVVRRKEWPHFFRFHVVTGMLLEIALQVTGTVWRWLPGAWYWGKAGMHFWTAFAFAFLFTVWSAFGVVVGMYADVPFVSDAAYIQIPYE
ncbi:hypothetical protein E3N88_45645 [Mikania micrantha]|uniref:Protein TIC 20 n=1 Tax=Mikania micrantha TaxID=192012 RepID=A0A5N6LAV0_9ASTR|nr:hypothetical protein E3N88_45645 [Mikania micrantha]